MSPSRIVVPGFPHHVVNRGHYRQPVFVRPGDYQAYLEDLIALKQEHGVKVHAYCLMTNHVHLLLAPETESGLAGLIQRLHARHTLRRNRRDGLEGTLWQGPFDSSVVDTDTYLLVCCRYIELNPVRAGMVSDPVEYRWSSCAARLKGDLPPWLDPDPSFLALGSTVEARTSAYRDFLCEAISEDQQELIREAIQRGQLTGDPDFAERIADKVGRVVQRRGPGRPRHGKKLSQR